MKVYQYFLVSIFILLFTACSQSVTIKAIKPAKVYDKDLKQIAIDRFKNDNISLSSNIKSKLSNIKFNNKKYFHVVNTNERYRIEKEQKLQDSGLVNLKDDKVFEFGEINSLITGKINNTTYNKTYFFEQRIDYNTCIKYHIDKKGRKVCNKYRKFNIQCTNYNFNVNSTVNITRISNNDLIHSKNYNKNNSIKRCDDYNNALPSTTAIYNKISQNIANDFVSLLTPSYDHFKVTLKEDEDIDYNKMQEKTLENGLELIKEGYLNKANELFKNLVITTKYKSITALFNYAVTHESLGNLQEALDSYKKAEVLSFQRKIDKDILKAIKRVELSMKNKNNANKQISQ